MKIQPARFFRGRVLCIFLSLVSGGCFLSPHGAYQVPDAIGKGNIRGGIGGGASFLGFSSECYQDGEEKGGVCAIGANAYEGQGFIDVGIGESSDLRIRFSGTGAYDSDEGNVFAIGPGFELKFSYGSIAMLLGADFLFVIAPGYEDNCENSDNDGWCIDINPNGLLNASLHIGTVIGIGEPGSLRLLITPKFGVSASGMLGHSILTLGLDLPLSENLSLRPEIGGGCYFAWSDAFGNCGMTSGLGIVF